MSFSVFVKLKYRKIINNSLIFSFLSLLYSMCVLSFSLLAYTFFILLLRTAGLLLIICSSFYLPVLIKPRFCNLVFIFDVYSSDFLENLFNVSQTSCSFSHTPAEKSDINPYSFLSFSLR